MLECPESKIQLRNYGTGSRPMPGIPERGWELRSPEFQTRKLTKFRFAVTGTPAFYRRKVGLPRLELPQLEFPESKNLTSELRNWLSLDVENFGMRLGIPKC